MNNEYENLDSLLKNLYGEKEAEAVKEDIRKGDEILASSDQLVPDPAVISEIKKNISERHRHRYEVNNNYREQLEEKGLVLSGVNPDIGVVEMIELPDHPWYVATQAHPELKSQPVNPHPLFKDFVAAAVKKAEG